ncbi:MarR family transcriptional regulator [Geodermatophilus sp. TF02-6]|uniref:MarR family transcriptional regulator n=1 Tax=Geodermatophilus sp. TF02-6 TaxID=2250575 RepID=UPI0013147D75|nr:MarR family transcriptional regulator [Geodermatophilus sp. TF02-6]
MLARHEQALTAGRLAELTGLSTSATTAMLDRLERRGFLERRRDPDDRRKVVVAVTGRHVEELGGIFTELADTVRQVLDGYDDEQLQLLTDFVLRLNALAHERTSSLTGASVVDAAATASELSPPRSTRPRR